MSKRIILIGKGASGKDYLREKFVDKGFKYATSFTTRPPRKGEVHGIDYNFMDKEDFEKRIKMDFWYEYVPFNGWYYGTSKQQWRNDDLFIMTPSGLAHLNEEEREESLVIFLDISEEIRKQRLSGRKDGDDKIERRLAADEADFKDFSNYDIRINNPEF